METEMEIRINAEGRKVIPFIKPETIITIHGLNGTGKSMAATLLEIASGNYIFKNETRFNRLKNVIDRCEINFTINQNEQYTIKLDPVIWRFDKNLNSIISNTLGEFYHNNEKITYEELRNDIYIKTIRGDESLTQQIFFFWDVFQSKISQKLEDIEDRVVFIENYKNWIDNQVSRTDIDKYLDLNTKYNESLTEIDTLNTQISNLDSQVRNTETALKILDNIQFVLNYDKDEIIGKIDELNSRISSYTSERNKEASVLKQIQENKNKILAENNLEDKKRLKELDKLRKKKENAKTELIHSLGAGQEKENKQINLSVDLIDLNKPLEPQIQLVDQKLEETRKRIEVLREKNDKLLSMSSNLTKLRDLTFKASKEEYGNTKIISGNLDGIDIALSFKDIFEIVEGANQLVEKNDKLKEFAQKADEQNAAIKNLNKIKKLLEDIRKIEIKIRKIEQELKGSKSSLDDYIESDEKLEALAKKEKEETTKISNFDKELHKMQTEWENFNKILEKLEKTKTINPLILELGQCGIRREDLTYEETQDLIKKNQANLKKESQKLEKYKLDKASNEEKIESFKSKLSNVTHKIKTIAKQFSYIEVGEFIIYFEKHLKKVESQLESFVSVKKRLENFKSDLENVIKGKKARSEKHQIIISEHFNNMFKELYGKPEFFKYVFKDYSKIENFDISNRSITFVTPAGLKEKRDLEEFSSGEKTYAYCRSIITMANNVAKYNIVILDESYALLDHEHSKNLYDFQQEMIENGGIVKFVNILPLTENLHAQILAIENGIQSQRSAGFTEGISNLESELSQIQNFKEEVDKSGYYQETSIPSMNSFRYSLGSGNTSIIGSSNNSNDESGNSISDLLAKNGFKDSPKKISFILDGSNVARDNQTGKTADITNIIQVVKKLQSYSIPEEEIYIIVGSGIRHHLKTGHERLYETLLKQPNVTQAPAGTGDDWFIIKYAKDFDAFIVSNDRYLDYRQKHPELKDFIDEKLVKFKIFANKVNFDEDFNEKVAKLK